MMTIRERYLSDHWFPTLVDSLEHLIDTGKITPTEVREAAMLACINYEIRNPLPIPVVESLEEALRCLERMRESP